MPEEWHDYVWWLYPEQALEPLFTLSSSSLEDCQQLNEQVRAQTTPFELPFDITDLTRSTNLNSLNAGEDQTENSAC